MDLYVNKLAVVQFSENQSRIAVVFTPVSHLRGRGFRGAFALSSHFFGKKFTGQDALFIGRNRPK